MADCRWILLGCIIIIMPVGCKNQENRGNPSFFESQWANYKDERTPLPPSDVCEEVKERVISAARCFIDRRWSELESYLYLEPNSFNTLRLMRSYREKGPPVKDLKVTDPVQAQCIRVPLRYARYYIVVLRSSDFAGRLAEIMKDERGQLRTDVSEAERRFWREFAFVELKVCDRYFIEVLYRRGGKWYLLSPPLHMDSQLAQEVIESKRAADFTPGP